MELLGVVIHGMEIGALGRLPEGSYVQVNGDVVRVLNASRVEHALRRARLTGALEGPAAFADTKLPADRPLPTVTVRKRRHAGPHPQTAAPVDTAAPASLTQRRRLTLKKTEERPLTTSSDAAPAAE